MTSRIARIFVPTLALLSAALVTGCHSSGDEPVTPGCTSFHVTSVSPTDGSTGVAVNSAISVNFSCPVSSASVSGANVSITPAVSGVVSASGSTVTLAPSVLLAANTTYTVSLSANVSSQDGTKLPASYQFSFTTAAGSDTTAPSAVSNLAAGTVTATSVALGWTASGDDGSSGTAGSYELRYAIGAGCPLTSGNFGQGTRVTVGTPKPAGSAESFTVTGLSQKTAYCFALRVLDEVPNASGLSNVVQVSTSDATAPAAPAIVASVVDASTVRLDWTAVGDDGTTGTAASYHLSYASGAACPLTSSNFASGTVVTLPAPQAAGTAESAQVGSLTADNAYCFLLEVSDAAGNVTFSNGATAHTPDVTSPDPAVLSAQAITGSSVQLTWTAVGDDLSTGTATTQELRYLSGAQCPITEATFSTGTLFTLGAPDAAGTAESATVTGLSSDTDYCFMLKVSDEAGNASFSLALPARTLDVTPPAAPVLAAGSISDTGAQLSWLDVGEDGAAGGPVASQALYIASGSVCSTFSGSNHGSNTVGVGAPGAAGTSDGKFLSGLNADADYCFVLVVTDDAGNSTASNVVSLHTADLVAPAQPVLAAGTLGPSSLQVTWTEVGDNGNNGVLTHNDLRYGTTCPTVSGGAFTSGTSVTLSPEVTSPGTARTATASGLSGDTDYCFVLRSADEAGNATFSAPITLHTVDNVAPAVAQLSGNALGSSVTLTWSAPGDNGSQSGTSAASYLLAYVSAPGGTCPANEAAFVSPTILSSTGGALPAPAVEGTAQSVSLSLTEHTTYCFALESMDEVPNASGYSTVFAITTGASDITPPVAIADLKASVDSATSAHLTWTAPSDDVAATGYTVAYATGAGCPITQGSFGSATTIPQSLTPQAAGSAESFEATVTDTSVAICFAVESTDAAGNASAISNVAFPPQSATLQVDAAANDTVQLSWSDVGANFDQGVASSFAVLYAPAPFCPSSPRALQTLPGATEVSAGLPAPQAPPATETGSVSGLTKNASYCFSLKVTNAAGDSSYSSMVTGTMQDTIPPADVTLAVATAPSRGLTLTFNASGDDGLSGGPASSYELRWTVGAGCAAGFDFASAPNRQPFTDATTPGAPTSVAISGLSPSTHYCLAAEAFDAVGNHSTPQLLEADTGADTTAPDALVLATPAVGEVTSASATVRWTAPSDDAGDLSTGAVQSYDARYVKVAAAADCATLGVADYATATTVVSQPTPSAAPGATETASLALQTADLDQPVCLAVESLDAAGNRSAISNWLYLRDNTAPSAIADLAAVNPTGSGASLTFTAVGDDGATGTASSYEVRFLSGAGCSIDDGNFATGTLVTGLAAPHASGTAEQLDLTGLSDSTHYCVGVRVIDDAQNVSSVAATSFDTGAPATGSQISAVRAAIAAASATPVSLPSLPVHNAVVTYVKSGGVVGTSDGPGFVVQAGAGPALFVAIDPSTFSGTPVAVGDAVDFIATEGAWLACTVCSSTTGLYAVTGATSTGIRSTGNALPAAVDFSSATTATLPAPIVASNWANEALLGNVTLTVSGAVTSSGGYSSAPVKTAGVTTASANVLVRVPDSLATTIGLASGASYKLGAVPLWRQDGAVVFQAWTLADVLTPVVLAVSPADGTLNSSATAVSVTFSQPVDLTTLTAQAASGACTANMTVQLFTDGNLSQCAGLTLSLDATNKVLTATPAGGFAPGARYLLKLTGGATGFKSIAGVNGNSLAQVNGFELAPAPGATCTNKQVVISQVYGGGGNAGSVYKNDFIELHNRGSTPVDLTGWSVQYQSANGTTAWQKTAITTGTIPAGGYFLVQESAGTGGTTSLPTPDVAAGAISMSATAGKVALVSNNTAITGGCPAIGTLGVVDIMGFGATSCAVSTAGLSNPNSASRNNLACADTSTNFADFSVGLAAPRNSASPRNTCSCSGGASLNVAHGDPSEVNYCVLQWPNPNHGYTGPIPLTSSPGATVPSSAQTGVSFIYGQLYQGGLTPTGGGNANVLGEVGVGLAGQDPLTQYVFYPGTYNAPSGSNDEFQASFPAPATTGSYGIVYRFSIDQGAHWTFCDMNGDGSNPGLPGFNSSAYLPLTVQ